jgi:4-diphosphocytidyl-2-C-methyl-D-erythritol kinase
LGADVPVFVSGRAAFGEGVGERLTPLYPPLAPPEANYLIIKPNVFVSTRDVFQDPELTRNSEPITIHGFLASGGRNDCLEVVRRRYPEVARAIDWLSSFGTVRLTGTGACVFMVCEPAQARAILAQLPAGYEGFLARGLNASPLLSRLTASAAGAV